ncbi:vWA domain-containing protein [Terasakiella sp. SH-1]|uniref:vWA domain-containing protein n=1 Tax=Terasakiella sp. SH-1 TaxID=2560057 RepID=UPI0010748A75|nr:vWA domain-containing protein [Terasakiella sp. SH-1]
MDFNQKPNYSQEISSSTPGAILFLVDQSRSMNKPFGTNASGQPVKRAEVVAEALNNTLAELVNRCTRDEGVSDYFEVGVIGYGRNSRPEFCWEGPLKGRRMVSISEVAKHAHVEQKTIETEVRGTIVNETVSVSSWLSPVAGESTPMNGAINMARQTLEEWIYRNPKCFPPIVINITDGMANDVSSANELIMSTKRLTDLTTTDGQVLLINCHITDENDTTVTFPWSKMELPDEDYARILFEMSSDMPERYKAIICEIFDRDQSQTPIVKGMAFNADATALVKLLDIGTRQAFVINTASHAAE